jgi:ferric-dicitrate binding protein FerR (iron transport regulator)
VAKNKALPFIVHASGIQVKALGTEFNVTAYDNDNELSAVLLEGSVSFRSVKTGKAEIIKPGQKITYLKKSQETSIENVNAENYVAWSKGETRFEHLTMEEITKRLQRNHHVTFVIQNERIKKMHFTGTFRNYESLDQILKVINTNTNLSFKIVRDTVYLK